MNTIQLTIDGMHCGGCVQRVTDTLKKIPGIQTQKIDIGKATLLAEPEQAQAAVAALERIGFDARISEGG